MATAIYKSSYWSWNWPAPSRAYRVACFSGWGARLEVFAARAVSVSARGLAPSLASASRVARTVRRFFFLRDQQAGLQIGTQAAQLQQIGAAVDGGKQV